MKVFNARWLALAVVLVAGPALVSAQVTRCNMTSPCGGPPACGAGCGGAFPVWHGQATPCTAPNGSFNLIGTQYEATCAIGNGCPVAQPYMRFWQFDYYAKANNGCQRQDDVLNNIGWLYNSFLDDAGVGGAAGHWYMYQPNWQGGQVDGCYSTVASPAPTPRTVAEISFPDLALEGMAGHRSWFLVGSVGLDPLSNSFDFDKVTNGTGVACTPAEVVIQPVGSLTIAGKTTACTGIGTAGRVQVLTPESALSPPGPCPAFARGTVTLVAPSPTYGTDPGGPNPIEGFQIMYRRVAGGGPEPTSSGTSTPPVWAGWEPVFDSSDAACATRRRLNVIPYGTSGPITVAVPWALTADDYYFATRVVYKDASENPPGTFVSGDATTPWMQTDGPQITSAVSSHCGPVYGSPIAVEFGSVRAERTAGGIVVRWTTLSEDDTNGFIVYRSADPAGAESVIEVAPWVESHGANLEYGATDSSAVAGQAYYYYVQEVTSSGFGDRSEAVLAPAAGTSEQGGSSGGRSRGKRR